MIGCALFCDEQHENGISQTAFWSGRITLIAGNRNKPQPIKAARRERKREEEEEVVCPPRRFSSISQERRHLIMMEVSRSKMAVGGSGVEDGDVTRSARRITQGQAAAAVW